MYLLIEAVFFNNHLIEEHCNGRPAVAPTFKFKHFSLIAKGNHLKIRIQMQTQIHEQGFEPILERCQAFHLTTRASFVLCLYSLTKEQWSQHLVIKGLESRYTFEYKPTHFLL